jgi:hypothetical protein
MIDKLASMGPEVLDPQVANDMLSFVNKSL